MEIEWVQAVILIPQVQDPETYFGPALEEAVASEEIELPEIIAR